MTNYTATIEYLDGQRAAIVTLAGPDGEWAGAGRIECRPINGRVREALYEQGYVTASASAAAKGGRLDAYRVVTA